MPAVAPRVRTLLVVLTVVTTGLAARSPEPAGEPAIVSQAPGTQMGQPASGLPKPIGLVMGQVVDAGTGKPISGAIVAIAGGPGAVTLNGEVIGNMPNLAQATTPGAPRQLITGSDGRYLFRELSLGRYMIRVTAPGYLSGGVGQNRPTGAPQSIELTVDEEKRGDLTVRLWRSASLTGTITDETGSPAVSYPVSVFRRTMTGGPKLSPGVQTSTDDRGMYRISGLTPGDYLVALLSTQTTMPVATTEGYIQQVSAGGSSSDSEIFRDLDSSDAPAFSLGGYRVGDLTLSSNSGRGTGGSPSPAPGDDGRVFVYPTLFYPAAGVASQATVIPLASGEDRSGIDLQLKLSPSVRVSGVLMGPDGPARNFGLKLFPAGADAFTTEYGIETASTATDANGSFTFLGVTPGQYTLKALRMPRPVLSASSAMNRIEVSGPNSTIIRMSSDGPSTAPPPPLPTDLTLSATMSVPVGEADVTGLSVALRPGVRIGGRIVFEGSKAPPTPDQLQYASISIVPAGGSAPIQIAMAPKRVETDGHFSSVGFPPGRYLVSAIIMSAPGPSAGTAGWTFKSAMFDGRDVSDEGLEIGSEDVSSIVITFTDRTSDFVGAVSDAKGLPDKNASVVILPADSQSWKQGLMNARRLRTVRTTTTGAFAVTSLPPGEYLIAAVNDEALGEWPDPTALEKIAAIAKRVTLHDGDKRSELLTTTIIR